MTKQTNYVATVTDANSEFPPKGAAIPNSDRGLVSSAAEQTPGSVGAKDSWFIDTNVEPIASYPNNRLPRWQDLIPLSCVFTFNTTQVPVAPPATLDSTTALTLFFDSSGSMDEVFPTLLYMVNNILKPCLLPYYNNNSSLYDQRVRVLSLSNERTVQWLGGLPPDGATKVVNMTFSDESLPDYTNSINDANLVNIDLNVNPWIFLPNVQPTSQYISDINLANSRLSSTQRGIMYRVINGGVSLNNVTKQFYQAVFTGQGQYGGAFGLSTNPYATLMDDVLALGNTPQNAQYYANKVIEGLNLIGYNLSYC